MTRMTKIFSLLAAAALWQGCSSSSNSDDASTVDSSTTDGPNVFLSDGPMLYYKVTAVSGITDGCMIDPASFVDVVVAMSFNRTTQILSVGNQVGSPAQSSFGTGGPIGLTGTLMRENDVTDGTCTWHQKDVSQFTLTGGDIFTLDVTENQSAFTAMCTPPNTPCMTTYKATFAKTTAPTDGGTGG